MPITQLGMYHYTCIDFRKNGEEWDGWVKIITNYWLVLFTP